MAPTTKTVADFEVHPDDTHTDSSSMNDIPGYDTAFKWTLSEERQAVRKCDLLILPFIMLLFCFLQFDRTNVANALTDTLREDVRIDNTEINTAQTLYLVGFIMTEIPFNMISKAMGPERFLPITMFLWGIVTWSQIFMNSASGLYACRFFVGALEGGYIPGMALYISKFYTNQEIGLRYACFWASNNIAGALSGPLSIGLLSLRGRGGLAGWQWLFLIAFLSMVMITPMNTYAPSIIKGLGFSGLQANGMNSVGSVGALVFSISLAYSSDHLRERGIHITIGFLVGAVGLLWLALAPSQVSKYVLYGGVVVTQTGMGSAQGLNAAWLTSRMEEHKRPIALAAYVMCIQLAGFPGAQLFRAQDAPRYRFGLIVAASCTIAAAFVDGVPVPLLENAPQLDGINQRLQRLEASISTLVDRLGNKLDEPSHQPAATQAPTRDGSMEVDVAPVMLIQDAATQSGMTATSTADQHSATWSNKPLEPAEISHLLLLLVIMHKMLRLLTEPGSMSTMAAVRHTADEYATYCVGTRRIAILDGGKINACSRLLERCSRSELTNFEIRMVAEVRLYWIIYKQCMEIADERATEASLSVWKQEWAELFDEPRAQFLQMGYYFALLLTRNHSARRRKGGPSASDLDELLRIITSILHLAIDTADERTQHLTDHIYHIITFSALVLCRILHKYEDKLRHSHNVESLHLLVSQTVAWLRSIGLSCHVAHMLARTIDVQHQKTLPTDTNTPKDSLTYQDPIFDLSFGYQEYLTADMFDIDADDTWSVAQSGMS
ncbi:hypothetical protein PMZ80_006355 [Knufia obscura]|uniref:Major facilitator superfamily (MFS) profile domain-containing protein n=1 Tax=Knufia obscura TaxID=1635080 RepID=A0ABR0RLH5_9EURO|nr:hypothetical protein PMZ80_006355 [Knufia obscura]